MLGSCDVMAVITTTNTDAARQFYGQTLGLQLTGITPYALVFDAHGTTLRVAIAQTVSPAPYTVLGWIVPDIAATLHGLVERGVQPSRFEGVEQDGEGIWTTPTGSKVAWFKDPDGNSLSVTEVA